MTISSASIPGQECYCSIESAEIWKRWIKEIKFKLKQWNSLILFQNVPIGRIMDSNVIRYYQNLIFDGLDNKIYVYNSKTGSEVCNNFDLIRI